MDHGNGFWGFFSILLKGCPSQPFYLSKGIIQGDHISPFLFVIMVKCRSRSIMVASSSNALFGLKLYASAPPSTRQQFVDGTLLMGLPTIKETLSFKVILPDFSKSTGTYFSSTPLQLSKGKVVRIIEFQICNHPSKYLGVLLTDKHLTHSIWEYLVTKMEKILANRTFRTLNLVGHLVLDKFVLQAIPEYMYSTLATPNSMSNIIRNLQRNFIWRGSDKKQKWVLLAWDKLCKPKKVGGLGLRDPELLAQSLGAKMWSRWIPNPNSSWGIIWKENYVPTNSNEHLIRLNGIVKGSAIWSQAWHIKASIQNHNFWEIGNKRKKLCFGKTSRNKGQK